MIENIYLGLYTISTGLFYSRTYFTSGGSEQQHTVGKTYTNLALDGKRYGVSEIYFNAVLVIASVLSFKNINCEVSRRTRLKASSCFRAVTDYVNRDWVKMVISVYLLLTNLNNFLKPKLRIPVVGLDLTNANSTHEVCTINCMSESGNTLKSSSYEVFSVFITWMSVKVKLERVNSSNQNSLSKYVLTACCLFVENSVQ